MARPISITKDKILAAALNIVRKGGPTLVSVPRECRVFPQSALQRLRHGLPLVRRGRAAAVLAYYGRIHAHRHFQGLY